MSTLLFIIGGLFIVYGIYEKLFKPNDSKNQDFYSIFSANGLLLVKKLEEMHENNEPLKWFDERRIFNELSNSNQEFKSQEFETALGIEGYMDEPEQSKKYIAGDYYSTLVARLNLRYNSQFEVLDALNESESMEKFNLNIDADEFVHLDVNRVDWYDEKTITTSLNYGGYQFKIGNKGGFSYRMGSLKVIPNKKQEFQPIDRGTLYITNKRIIFVGTETRVNKTINLDDILEFSIFRDGILLGKTNGKKPLLIFEDYLPQKGKAPNKRDHLNRVVRVLNRVIRKNQFEEVSE